MAYELTERRRSLILAFAEHNMNLLETANASYMHRNTVEYQLNRIYKITGLNPKNFYDLVELVSIVKGKCDDEIDFDYGAED